MKTEKKLKFQKLQKKGSDDEDDESDVAMLSGDEFDAMVSESPAPVREKPGRRAASKVNLNTYRIFTKFHQILSI